MTFKLLNRARMSLLGTAGTGTLTVNAPAAGFQSLVNAGMNDGDTTTYVIDDGNPVGLAWEVGQGTWHSNGTFSRDTVYASSLGGTTKISVTSAGFVSGTFSAEDLGTPPDPTLFSAPVLVQYGHVQSNASGAHSVTLGATPTPGNLLVAIGQGGTGGLNLAGADASFSYGTTQFDSAWGIRRVRASGDGATWQIGTGNTHEFNGILAEVSGVDVTRFTPGLLSAQGSLGGSLTLIDALAPVNALSLLFVGANTGALTINDPATVQFNNDDGTSRLAFAYNTAVGGWNGLDGSTSVSNVVFVANLPGFSP